jgi:arylformamidase
VTPWRTFAGGHASSSSTLSFNTHSGTHVDAPLHFCPAGATIADLLGPGREFAPAAILDLPRTGDTCITPGDLAPLLPPAREARALLVRTGDSVRRGRDPEGYTGVHPWVHPDVPGFLRSSLPALRLFGLDTISISSPLHRDEGRACHRAFLCGSPPVLLLEDLDLSDLRLAGPGFSLRIYPWFREALDGVPVVALVETPGKEP